MEHGINTHRLDVNVVLPKEAGGCCGLVQTLDVVPGLLGTGLGLTILHTSHTQITDHTHHVHTHAHTHNTELSVGKTLHNIVKTILYVQYTTNVHTYLLDSAD